MDILGTASLLPVDTDGAVDAGKSDYIYRFAPLAGIYGGSLEVFRNMIAQHCSGSASRTTRRPSRRRPSSSRERAPLRVSAVLECIAMHAYRVLKVGIRWPAAAADRPSASHR